MTTSVVIPLYDRFTALDVIGPYQMLAFTPGVEVTFAAERAGTVWDDAQMLALQAVSFADVLQPDVVVVPGGPGTIKQIEGALPDWLKQVHPHTRLTTSVCSGSIILAAAGLLNGLRATTHYRHFDSLEAFGAIPTKERVVEQLDARIITAGGVSSGIDMALRLVELLTDATIAQAVQLWTEYDPQPPFDSGSEAKASADVRRLAAAYELAARKEVET